jgi:hypothetical protein
MHFSENNCSNTQISQKMFTEMLKHTLQYFSLISQPILTHCKKEDVQSSSNQEASQALKRYTSGNQGSGREGEILHMKGQGWKDGVM